MSNRAEIEIVIISYNTCQLVCNCIDSINKTAGNLNCEITVFDNNSSDNTIEHLTIHNPKVKLLKSDKNLGYAKSINMSVAESIADFIIVTNSDVEFHENSIEALTSFLTMNPTVGVVGPQQEFPDGTWQRSYGFIPGVKEGVYNLFGVTSLAAYFNKRLWKKGADGLLAKSVPYLDGAVLAIRRSCFNDVGGFDEDFFFYSEEADFCFRLKKSGWDVRFIPTAYVMHVRGGSSRANEAINEKYLRMQMNSKLLLVSKHFPAWHSTVYVFLQVLHFLKMYLATKIASYLTTGSVRKRQTARSETFRRLKSIWGEQLSVIMHRQGG